MNQLQCIFLILGVVSGAWAKTPTNELTLLRKDHNIPAACGELKISSFMNVERFVTIGTYGAREQGFDMEVGVTNYQAHALFNLLQNRPTLAQARQSLRNFSPFIRDLFLATLIEERRRVYSHYETGDILELMAVAELRRSYPDSAYFITGGLQYAKASGRPLGELDVVVFRRSDCQAVLVGEAKMRRDEIFQARQQLRRFQNYLKTFTDNRSVVVANDKSRRGTTACRERIWRN